MKKPRTWEEIRSKKFLQVRKVPVKSGRSAENTKNSANGAQPGWRNHQAEKKNYRQILPYGHFVEKYFVNVEFWSNLAKNWSFLPESHHKFNKNNLE